MEVIFGQMSSWKPHSSSGGGHVIWPVRTQQAASPQHSSRMALTLAALQYAFMRCVWASAFCAEWSETQHGDTFITHPWRRLRAERGRFGHRRLDMYATAHPHVPPARWRSGSAYDSTRGRSARCCSWWIRSSGTAGSALAPLAVAKTKRCQYRLCIGLQPRGSQGAAKVAGEE